MPLDQTQQGDAGHGQEDVGFPVVVSYNGVDRELRVLPHETIAQVLVRAIAAYGNLTNPHTLSLYSDEAELEDGKTVQDSNVRPHDKLLLRPGKVKGG